MKSHDREPCTQDGAPHRLVTRQIRHGRTYLGDVPADGRVIEVLPLVVVGVVLHLGGVGTALRIPYTRIFRR